MTLKIRHCDIAEQHHQKAKRQYAHMGHIDNVICICKAFLDLPPSHYYGILAHEIGHQIVAKSGYRPQSYKDGERAADVAIEQLCNLKVRYASTDFGENLQYLTGKDIKKLTECITFA